MLRSGSFRIGQPFGIELRVHWSLPVMLALLALSSGLSGGLPAMAATVMMVSAVFLFVALHELGHCLTARKFHVPVRGITLWPLGGVAEMAGMELRPRTEFWVAIAGPAVNFALALLLVPFAYLASALHGVTFFNWLVGANLVLGTFNLLPAFPMDGGRILRAWLASRGGNHLLATERAVATGKVVALLMGLAGLVLDPWLVVLAVFVWLLGQQELQMARLRAFQHQPPPVEQVFADFIRGFHPRDSPRW